MCIYLAERAELASKLQGLICNLILVSLLTLKSVIQGEDPLMYTDDRASTKQGFASLSLIYRYMRFGLL